MSVEGSPRASEVVDKHWYVSQIVVDDQASLPRCYVGSIEYDADIEKRVDQWASTRPEGIGGA